MAQSQGLFAGHLVQRRIKPVFGSDLSMFNTVLPTFARRALRAPLAPLAAVLAALLGGCVNPPPTAEIAPTAVPAMPASYARTQPSDAAGAEIDPSLSARYRVAAAYHLYELNPARIYDGVMPHYLYAIGVLQVRIDPRGNPVELKWLRAPEHAPEVMAEIERTVKAAAPFPAPTRMAMKNAVYVDTWLWDASGRFQLHTLSKGQGPSGTAPRAMPERPEVPALLSSLSGGAAAKP